MGLCIMLLVGNYTVITYTLLQHQSRPTNQVQPTTPGYINAVHHWCSAATLRSRGHSQSMLCASYSIQHSNGHGMCIW